MHFILLAYHKCPIMPLMLARTNPHGLRQFPICYDAFKASQDMFSSSLSVSNVLLFLSAKPNPGGNLGPSGVGPYPYQPQPYGAVPYPGGAPPPPGYPSPYMGGGVPPMGGMPPPMPGAVAAPMVGPPPDQMPGAQPAMPVQQPEAGAMPQ